MAFALSRLVNFLFGFTAAAASAAATLFGEADSFLERMSSDLSFDVTHASFHLGAVLEVAINSLLEKKKMDAIQKAGYHAESTPPSCFKKHWLAQLPKAEPKGMLVGFFF